MVRALAGDRNTLSSPGLDSSHSRDAAESLGVESADTCKSVKWANVRGSFYLAR